MERIEELVHPDAPKQGPHRVRAMGRLYDDIWLPSLPCPMYGLRYRLADAWAVLTGRATAVQWPHQREGSDQGERG